MATLNILDFVLTALKTSEASSADHAMILFRLKGSIGMKSEQQTGWGQSGHRRPADTDHHRFLQAEDEMGTGVSGIQPHSCRASYFSLCLAPGSAEQQELCHP